WRLTGRKRGDTDESVTRRCSAGTAQPRLALPTPPVAPRCSTGIALLRRHRATPTAEPLQQQGATPTAPTGRRTAPPGPPRAATRPGRAARAGQAPDAARPPR